MLPTRCRIGVARAGSIAETEKLRAVALLRGAATDWATASPALSESSTKRGRGRGGEDAEDDDDDNELDQRKPARPNGLLDARRHEIVRSAPGLMRSWHHSPKRTGPGSLPA